ncbi:hypothetical protein CEXT_674971 [Caerostris extrusa]|uniref:Uncharacterized protein n=1 Tax=Caerostris extrusa TaxID=172846 RepID=A0AAV4S4Y8_CAEEX|nr:hypothetical protein CEXT_674971 [Caerostris extrusa]
MDSRRHPNKSIHFSFMLIDSHCHPGESLFSHQFMSSGCLCHSHRSLIMSFVLAKLLGCWFSSERLGWPLMRVLQKVRGDGSAMVMPDKEAPPFLPSCFVCCPGNSKKPRQQ